MDEQQRLVEEGLRQMREDLAEYPTLSELLVQAPGEGVAREILRQSGRKLPVRFSTIDIWVDQCFRSGKRFQVLEADVRTSALTELIGYLETTPFSNEWDHPGWGPWRHVLRAEDPAVTEDLLLRAFHHVTNWRHENLLRCSLWRLKFLDDYWSWPISQKVTELLNDLVDRDFSVEAFVEALNDPARASEVERDLYRGRKNGHMWCQIVPPDIRHKIARNYRKAKQRTERAGHAAECSRVVAAYRKEADAVVRGYVRFANATDDEIRALGLQEIGCLTLAHALAEAHRKECERVCSSSEQKRLMRHPVETTHVGPLYERIERIRRELLEESRREQVRREREKHEAAMRARDEKRVREAHLNRARERIAARVSRVVGVFNGAYGLSIDPHALLAGEVTGEYASISSSPQTALIGQTLQLKHTLAMYLDPHMNTWLELEEGDDDAEIERAYRSANFLVCHELGHLAPLAVVQEAIASAGFILPNDPALRIQAHEIVIDAIGYRLGTDMYVHPDNQAFAARPAARRRIMRTSFEAMLERVMQRPEAVTDQLKSGFLARLCAVTMQLFNLDPTKTSPIARTFLDWCWSLAVSRELVEVYRKLFCRVVDDISVADIAFLPHVEASHESFAPVDAAPTLH